MIPPPSSILMCARDAQVVPGDLHLLKALKRGRNNIFILSVRGKHAGNDVPQYFIKERAGNHFPERWRVDLDYAGLTHLYKHDPINPGFGAIKPIGFEEKPRKYLATRYQSGPTLDVLFNKAIKSGSGLDNALSYSHMLGQWLAAFRQSGGKATEPGSIQRAVRETSDRLFAINETNPQSAKNAARLIDYIEKELRGGERTWERIARPNHGDMGAQNFILGNNGTIFPIDMSAFGFKVLGSDAALYRIRLEKAGALGGRATIYRSQELWRFFWDGYIVGGGESPHLCLLSYMYKLSRMLLPQKSFLACCKTPRAIGRAFRDHCWRQKRLLWLAQMPRENASLLDYMRNVL